VAPVEIDGIRYEQDTESYRHGGDQPGGYLVAIDPKTGNRLWMLKVYPVEDHRAAGVTGGGLYFSSMARVPGEKTLEIVNGVQPNRLVAPPRRQRPQPRQGRNPSPERQLPNLRAAAPGLSPSMPLRQKLQWMFS
jgi:hypothetical protein